jgi:cobalt-zinc-cadmium efflux system membrane fusion protein
MSIRRRATATLLGVLATLTACKRDAEVEGATDHLVTGARTAAVTEQSFSEQIEATGVVTGRPGKVAALSAPAPARISSVLVVVGQRVTAGTALVELDQVSFRGAAQSADVALAAAERNAARQQRLADAGVVPRKDVEQAAAELAAAKATAENARRQAELSVVRSPIAGIVTQVNAVLGATADPAIPLVHVSDASALDVVFNVTPAQAAVLRAGAHVALSSGTLGDATVTTVGGAVDSATRAVTVRATVTRSARQLQLGETVSALIAAGSRPHALVVPLEALVPDGEGFKVFVVDANGIAHARPVTVGGRTSALAEITNGVKAGEQVVTYGAFGVDDSVKVAPAATPARTPDAK